jgi:drug/metabolite transporter (DMT)-like permease
MLGYAVFGDVPDLLTLVGAAVIIAAGLYIFWREQGQGRREPQPPAHP